MKKSKEDQSIYKKLRELRRARGLTVDHLAKQIGEDSQKVGRIERGKRSLTVDYLLKISKAFETPVDVLMEEKKEEMATAEKSAILSDVVVFVEQHLKGLISPSEVDKRAHAISKIYELALEFPKEQQKLFLASMGEILALLQK